MSSASTPYPVSTFAQAAHPWISTWPRTARYSAYSFEIAGAELKSCLLGCSSCISAGYDREDDYQRGCDTQDEAHGWLPPDGFGKPNVDVNNSLGSTSPRRHTHGANIYHPTTIGKADFQISSSPPRAKSPTPSRSKSGPLALMRRQCRACQVLPVGTCRSLVPDWVIRPGWSRSRSH